MQCASFSSVQQREEDYASLFETHVWCILVAHMLLANEAKVATHFGSWAHVIERFEEIIQDDTLEHIIQGAPVVGNLCIS